MSTPKESVDRMVTPRDFHEEQNGDEQVILLTNPRKPTPPQTVPSQPIIDEHSTQEVAASTNVELEATPKSNSHETEEILLLTKPAKRTPPNPKQKPKQTWSYSSLSSVEEQSIIGTNDQESKPSNTEQKPRSDTPPDKFPDFQLEMRPFHDDLWDSTSESADDLSSVMRAPQDDRKTPQSRQSYDTIDGIERSIEAELMLDLLGESPSTEETTNHSKATLTLESKSAPPSDEGDTKLSLSGITALLEEDDIHPIEPYSKTYFRPAHEYLAPPEASKNPNHRKLRQIQQINRVLSELTQHCARACCFLYRDSLLIGMAAMGKGKIQERIENLLFPVDVPSLLSHAVQTQKPYFGALRNMAMDQIMFGCFGGPLPQQVAVTPIIQSKRVVAVFQMDDGGESNFPLEPAAFQKILQKTNEIDFRWSLPTIHDILLPILPKKR